MNWTCANSPQPQNGVAGSNQSTHCATTQEKKFIIGGKFPTIQDLVIFGDRITHILRSMEANDISRTLSTWITSTTRMVGVDVWEFFFFFF